MEAAAAASGRPREPAWHRRARAQRAGARFAGRVAAACALLGAHHGGAPTAALLRLRAALAAPAPSAVPVP
eukprot:14859478-Heterocapsa_arctica.AAC.1